MIDDFPFRITRLDHLVLTVRDIAVTVGFYVDALGMGSITSGGRTALVFGEQKINLHEAGNEFEPKAALPTPGSADLCLLVDTPLQTVIAHLAAIGVEILEGPAPRTGAVGAMESIYFRDPDGNLIEVASPLP